MTTRINEKFLQENKTISNKQLKYNNISTETNVYCSRTRAVL